MKEKWELHVEMRMTTETPPASLFCCRPVTALHREHGVAEVDAFREPLASALQPLPRLIERARLVAHERNPGAEDARGSVERFANPIRVLGPPRAQEQSLGGDFESRRGHTGHDAATALELR